MGMIDFVIGFGKVAATSIHAKTKEAVFQVLGLQGFEEGQDQSAEKQVGYTGLGLVGHPLPSEKILGILFDVDVIYVKQGDELVPIAWRDLRLNRNFPGGVRAGTIALAGYGGGFYSLDLTPSASGSRKANIHVLYCPFDFDSNGVPQKAHTIILDPAGNSINLLHASGSQFILLDGKKLMMISDDATWFKMEPGKIDMQANTVTVAATLVVGNPLTALPLAAGPAVLPSTRILYSST
jgi:hypothetical protein